MDELKIERDASVMAEYREVGRVTHVIVDPQTKEITQVVVAHDNRESTIPIAAIVSAGGGTVRLREGADAALRGDFARDAFHGLDDRTADAENAGIATHGGAPLRDAAADAVVIARPAAMAEHVGTQASATEGALRVPVAEERLAVGTREVELGAVAIRKTVTAEQVAVPVTLTREEVRVAERAVTERPATGADPFTEGTVRVPIRGEEAVVAKEAVVTGEVVVNKERVVEEGQLTDTVRREHVEVEETTVRGTTSSAPAKARHDNETRSGGTG